jgi:hypothetical protein
MKIGGAISIIAGVAALILPWFSAKPPVIDDPDPDPIETPVPYPTPTRTPVPVYSGTYGTNMPVIFDEWWLRKGDKFAIISGPSLKENGEFRTNLMFTWVGHIEFDIEILVMSGTELGTLHYNTSELEPCSTENCSGYYQINNIVTLVNKEYYDLFTIKVIPKSGDGKVLFFATSIDNRSQDPTMYSQFRFAGDGSVWSESGLYVAG